MAVTGPPLATDSDLNNRQQFGHWALVILLSLTLTWVEKADLNSGDD